MSDGPDRTMLGTVREDGSVARPLLWLLAGLVAVVLLGLAIAPELLADLGSAAEVGLLVVAAGVPGVALLLVVAARRRGEDAADDTSGEG